MARLPQNPYNGFTGKEREAKLRAHGQAVGTESMPHASNRD